MRKIVQDPQVVAAKLRKGFRLKPRLAIVLGSGFQSLIQAMDVETEVPYRKLPGFPIPTVAGHEGRLVSGRLAGTPVMVLSGRAHFYEGHDLATVTFPIRVLAACQIKDVLLTNAAGGINPRFRPGDLMVIRDHINLIGSNPLRGGAHACSTSRFVDLTGAYDQGLQSLMQKAGRKVGLKLQSGVYVAVCGPSYETPAEIRAFARLGADAVGMSTVPEVIVARQCGLRVAGLSCITNLAAGLSRKPISHSEVLQTAEQVRSRTCRLLTSFAGLYAGSAGELSSHQSPRNSH